MDNFFQKPLNDGGTLSGFRDINAHTTTFGPHGPTDHLTFNQPYNALGHRRDFSLETSVRLNGFNNMGGLEQRTTLLDTFQNSPFNP